MNVSLEEVKGLKNGIPYHGLVYSALGDNKQKVGTPFKSSLFGKSLNLEALQKHFEKSKQTIKTNKTKEYIKPIISKAMQQAKSKEDFKLLLIDKNIESVFRENERGRIYGVTFIDYKNKTALNGSRLGKEFSANVLEERQNNSAISSGRNILPTVDKKLSTQTNHTLQSTDSFEHQDVSSINFNLFEQHGVDYDNENFVRENEKEQRRRKRKGRGMR